MSRHIIFLFALFILLSASAIANENDEGIEKKDIFRVRDGAFHLNGEKFNIYAGEIHYFRIAACEWEDRLRKLQRAGLNTVSTAVEWAMHEPIPESYNWKGNANFTQFVELAHKLDLFVIVRAGPYIGADRSLGGIPGWLLTTNELKDNPWIQRSSPEYRLYAERWLSHILPKLSKMMITNGGPVLMVQIDSDLGETSPCVTTDWLHEIYSQYLSAKTIMFTMDHNDIKNLKCGKLKNCITAFRTNPWEYFTIFKQSLPKLYSTVKKISPNCPKLVEIQTGLAWDWGSERFTFGTKKIMKTIKDLVKSDASVIIYMFAGGTNFERPGKSESSSMGLTTSYDFDAIVTESGDLTEKFYKLESILHGNELMPYEKQNDEANGKQGTIDISGELNFTSLGSLLDPYFRKNFGLIGIESRYPMTFAKLNITNGFVLYETKVPKTFKPQMEATLHSKEIYDRGYVYINNNLVGILDNRNSLQVPIMANQIIQILVENTGYLAQNVIGEPKGIIGNVTLNGKILTNWTAYPLSLDNVRQLQSTARKIKDLQTVKNVKLSQEGNAFLLATFQIPNHIVYSTLHTYLNMNHHSAKGHVFLNEHSVGKYWINGPQYELYIPECYFRQQPMENQLLIIQLQKQRLYYDENGKTKTKKNLNKSGDTSKTDNENLIIYVILFYICWFCKPGNSCIGC